MRNEVKWKGGKETYLEALDREVTELKAKKSDGWEVDVQERQHEIQLLLNMARICMRPRPGEEGRPLDQPRGKPN